MKLVFTTPPVDISISTASPVFTPEPPTASMQTLPSVLGWQAPHRPHAAEACRETSMTSGGMTRVTTPCSRKPFSPFRNKPETDGEITGLKD